MKVIIFDIKGKFAHFRKFYTNSSSLTYGIPPRTTISGMVAAILGFERDSYYETLSSNKLRIGVKKLTTTRKLLQTLNYMKVESVADLFNPKNHTQVPFEVVAGENDVCFRIYLSHVDSNITDELEYRIIENKFVYPPYLGSANFGCAVKYIDTLEAVYTESKNSIRINTAIRSEEILEMDIANYTGKLMKERMPVDFSENKVKNKFIRLSNGEDIIFM